MSRGCSTNGVKRNAYRIFVKKPKVKTQPGRSRRKWKSTIKMELREIGRVGVVGFI
jgi:hypothetical protein